MPRDTAATGQPRGPAIDLKWSLMWRVALVALLCFLAGAAVAIYRVQAQAIAANQTVGDAVGKHLDLQLLRIESALDLPGRFPDADALLAHVLSPGQCVQYLDTTGKTALSNCMGFDSVSGQAPAWFTALFRLTQSAEMRFDRPIMHRGASHGRVVVTGDPAAVTLGAWSEISRLLGLSLATIAALCVLVYFVIERALRPTKDVLAGLNRLAAGDLTTRLPSFQLVELQRISDVFNGLAGTLETTIAERAGLARRLVDAQERERRHLARELHDELAQSLSAMSATAASIKVTAVTDCPALVPEAQTLAETAGTILKVLRRTLQTLRPPEIDELGLVAGLQGLVADHNGRARGVTQFRLETNGDVGSLPLETAVHVYRIVQEGLTNAAKHAQAGHVTVGVCVPQQAAGTVDLVIEDDGLGQTDTERDGSGFGLGLTGIRERVLALDGTIDVQSKPGKGLILSVTLPGSNPRSKTSEAAA